MCVCARVIVCVFVPHEDDEIETILKCIMRTAANKIVQFLHKENKRKPKLSDKTINFFEQENEIIKKTRKDNSYNMLN